MNGMHDGFGFGMGYGWGWIFGAIVLIAIVWFIAKSMNHKNN